MVGGVMNQVSMSWALRHLKEGPVVVMLRHRSPVLKVIGTSEKDAAVTPLDELIELRVVRFREIVMENSDQWELTVEQQHPQTQAVVRTMWYVHGTDILCVQAMSKVAT